MTWQRSDLRPYQNFFVDKIKQSFDLRRDRRLPGCILALPPGAGKTGAALTACRDLLDGMVIRKVLVVAPLLVAQTTWPDEFHEWAHLGALTRTLLRVEDDDPDVNAVADAVYAEALSRYQAQFDAEVAEEQGLGLRAKHARADAKRRWEELALSRLSVEDREAGVRPKSTPGAIAELDRQAVFASEKLRKLAALADDDAEVHIINKEAMPWLWRHFGEGRRWPYDLLVIDDCREGRSGKKRVGKDRRERESKSAPLSRFGIFAKARKHVGATVQMTGTPTPKGLQNMWGLAYLVDLGERLGTSKTAFERRWFNVNRYTRKVEAHAHSFDEIMGRVKDIMFSLGPDNMPDLPPYIVDPIRVRLSKKTLDAYRHFERKLVSEEYDVEAVNAGVLHGKLLQFANGSMYREDGDDVFVHDLKIEALKTLVERLNGTPLLTAYTYQFDVDRIMKAFPKAVVLRPENAVETVRLWNADKIELLLAHRASAGHGLNLQKGTGHMCEYGLTTDLELYLQFLMRLLRSGRKSTVFNHVIMAEGTIDEDVYPMYLNPKQAEQDRIMEAVRVSFGNHSFLT